jgi:hypothetical protein
MQYVLHNFSHPYGCLLPSDNCQNISKDEIVIHIRSGDIFDRRHYHRMYTQPPVLYYETIFQLYKWPKVLFVTSTETKPSLLNPVWSHYKHIASQPALKAASSLSHSVVRFQQSSSVLNDFQTLMCARNFVMAHSTFSLCVAHTSHLIRNSFSFYSPSSTILSADAVTNSYYYSVYLGENYSFTNWTNSAVQRKNMLTFNGTATVNVTRNGELFQNEFLSFHEDDGFQ